MPETERYSATRRGPGTIRDPLDATAVEDDASDEFSDVEGSCGDGGAEQPVFNKVKINMLICVLLVCHAVQKNPID